MTARSTVSLSRATGHGRAAAPIRMVHLGLGSFFRAHQAWYTDHAPDAEAWGIAAFTGHQTQLAHTLAAQDGLFTLTTRSATTDTIEIVSSLSRAYAASDHDRWLQYFASPEVRVVTLTITEAGYQLNALGGLDTAADSIQRDLALLSNDSTSRVGTAFGRLIAGLIARRASDAGPLTIVSCDNLPHNGVTVAQALQDFAQRLDPVLANWITESVTCVSSVVDRITPDGTSHDIESSPTIDGLLDLAPVVSEAFTEWVMSGAFPAGRPRWERAGALFAADITPFEDRKLWLLNGGHSLLAYAGSIRGCRTVAEAITDRVCRSWIEDWWSEAAPHLNMRTEDVNTYRDTLIERLENARVQHQLTQIAADGSQKLPARVLPVLRAERVAGRLPLGAMRILGAWICHLHGMGAPVQDSRAGQILAGERGSLQERTCHVLRALDPALADDHELIAGVAAVVDEMSR